MADPSPADDLPAVPAQTEEPTFSVTTRTRLYHTALLEAVRKLGSIKALADHLEISHGTLAKWIYLKSVPKLLLTGFGKLKNGKRNSPIIAKWPEITRKLFELTGQSVQQLFPDFLGLPSFQAAPKTIERVHAVPVSQLIGLPAQEIRNLPSPSPGPAEEAIDIIAREEMLVKIPLFLDMLTQRERLVVKMRFGLGEFDGKTHTLEAIGKLIGVTRGRIRQIEGKALLKLRRYADRGRIKNPLE